jgi:uncharacterized protein (UPF0548 family)
MFLCTAFINGKKIPNESKIYQMTINIPNGRRRDQRAIKYVYHPKFTQNWGFGLKINHLATLGVAVTVTIVYIGFYKKLFMVLPP